MPGLIDLLHEQLAFVARTLAVESPPLVASAAVASVAYDPIDRRLTFNRAWAEDVVRRFHAEPDVAAAVLLGAVARAMARTDLPLEGNPTAEERAAFGDRLAGMMIAQAEFAKLIGAVFDRALPVLAALGDHDGDLLRRARVIREGYDGRRSSLPGGRRRGRR